MPKSKNKIEFLEDQKQILSERPLSLMKAEVIAYCRETEINDLEMQAIQL